MNDSAGKFLVRIIAKALEVLALSFMLLGSDSVMAQSESPNEILSPADGAVLTGVVEIRGTVAAVNFLSAALEFSYSGTTGAQWFSIADVPAPVVSDRLALWDTSTISDGAYVLRLRVNGTDGTVHDAVIGVQVRNYTTAPTAAAQATSTVVPSLRISTPVVAARTPAAVSSQAETPTPLPANPARITKADLMAGAARGGLAVLAAFLLWGAVNLRGRL